MSPFFLLLRVEPRMTPASSTESLSLVLCKMHTIAAFLLTLFLRERCFGAIHRTLMDFTAVRLMLP